jgi:hypothetical protein
MYTTTCLAIAVSWYQINPNVPKLCIQSASLIATVAAAFYPKLRNPLSIVSQPSEGAGFGESTLDPVMPNLLAKCVRLAEDLSTTLC